jgi:hypothetical protein
LLYFEGVFGMNGGEMFLVAFVTVAVVSARYWPALGERIAVRLVGGARPGPGPTQDSLPDDPPRE